MPEAGDLDVEAAAGDLDAAVDRLPELDTTVSPATEDRLAELAGRRASQAEADADRLRREANAQAALAAEATVTGAEAEAWAPVPLRVRRPGSRPGGTGSRGGVRGARGGGLIENVSSGATAPATSIATAPDRLVLAARPDSCLR